MKWCRRRSYLVVAAALVVGGCSALSDAVDDETPDSISEERDSVDVSAPTRDDEREALEVADTREEWEQFDAGEEPMQRWHHRPDRCRGSDSWNEVRGDEDEVPNSVFHESPTDALDADDRLVRFICGAQVNDIESSDMDPLFDHSTNRSDPRRVFSRALEDDETYDSRKTLYSAALAHKCWHATNWDDRFDSSYNIYLHCQDVATDLPSVDEVEEAMEIEFPGHDFEMDNLLFSYERALDDKDRVLAEGAEFEAQYPVQREVFHDAAREAEQRFEERQESYGDIIAMVDPITDSIFDGESSQDIDECFVTAEQARSKLADRIDFSSAEDMEELRIGHPVGYQITEALAHCYLKAGQFTKAHLEARALESGTRRVTLGEEIRLARQEALYEVKREHDGDTDAIRDVIPFTRMGRTAPMILPTETYRTPSFSQKLFDAGFSTLELNTIGGLDTGDDDDGDDEASIAERRGFTSVDTQPIIDEIETVDTGAKITFVRTEETVTRQDSECEKTDRVESWSFDGDEMVPNYEVVCNFVGEPWEETIEHQYDPVVVPVVHADLLEPGMRVEVTVNEGGDDGDAVVRRAWPDDDGDVDTVVVDGWAVH